MKGKLKRCAGCSIAKYCSRECQKNAWPTHKEFCRRPGTSSQPDAGSDSFAGFPTAISLADAIREWVRIHDYGFNVIANATVLLNGGVDRAFASPQALRFELDIGPNNKGDGNPANVFKLDRISLDTKESFLRPTGLTDAEAWDRREEQCRYDAMRKRVEFPHVTITGVLPAAFLVLNTGLVAWHQFPVFAPRHFDFSAPLAPPLQFLLDDLIAMSLVAMNAGDILRLPKVHIGRPEPEVGNLIRRDKQWKWRNKDEDAYWEALDMRTVKGFLKKTGMHPRDIWKCFHTL
ncbi:hypothetical protein BN946_scf185000.g11 [Trametes cinnabarina]|uniref:MYND-type domain-containing protein n=1 Tax=Pycnoporus cinnabarinus TaxID=5643 RepID=A0A060S916_PYCCI|nr:hypothetical protein BN946_scf185000.g11 [Trametes cinnabarina]